MIWTKEEDERLISIILICVECGLSKRVAFSAAAFELTRTHISCQARFYKFLYNANINAELLKAEKKGARARKYGVNIRELLNGLVG